MWMQVEQSDKESRRQAENGKQDQGQGQGEEEVTPPAIAGIRSRAEARGHRDAMPLILSGIRFLFPAPLRFYACRLSLVLPASRLLALKPMLAEDGQIGQVHRSVTIEIACA